MSSEFPSIPPVDPTPVAAIPTDSSLWDRISTWASDNKAVVYTIAGVAVVVTGAGVVYYVNSSVRPSLSLRCRSGANPCRRHFRGMHARAGGMRPVSALDMFH